MSALSGVRLHVAGRTDVGLIREHNEDSFAVVDLGRDVREAVDGMRSIDVTEGGALLLVCDGMGGAAAGEVASKMAVDSVWKTLTAALPAGGADATDALTRFARRMRSAAFTANQAIFDESRSDSARAGMGTTMTAVGVVGTNLVMAQVGDSRAYVLRGGQLVQVTRDQSLVNQLVETGQITEEQAKLFEHSNVILQALGVQPDVEVLLSTVALHRGDRVVVCSDGLTGVVTDEELAALLGSTEDMAEVCRLLVEMARAGGGPDNITVVAARLEGDALPAAEGPKVAYERWRLDEPEPVPDAVAEAQETEASPRRTQPLPQPVERAELFFSAMLLFALLVGGAIVSSLLHRSAPFGECAIAAAPGLAVRLDGRDIGARTGDGPTTVKLPPGRHRLGVRGPGAPGYERTVEIAAGDERCSARFDAAQP